MIKIFRSALLCLCLVTGFSNQSFAQAGGTVKGIVTDKTNGEALPGATVGIKGTTTGTVTGMYGEYNMFLPQGEVTLQIRFIGYKVFEKTLQVNDNDVIQLDVELEMDALMGEEVIITAQAVGQAAAINQQINANTIVNVVSQDKIRELPDQNAAETLGRLPGISVQRSGGEGQRIVMRGLSPRFTSITINGERIPASSDDRSVDISMMSPDVLAGIEVFKALTPDKDADAIGGTVNFRTKRASREPELNGYFQYG
jgi:outer membrane receptor protein involved in Fe transport